MVLRLTRDAKESRRSQRTIVSFAASLLLHAIAALLLFSLPTSSSEQAPPESFANGAIVTVSRQAPPHPQVAASQAPPPLPHAPVVARPRPAARPQAAPPHPRVLHELSKNSPTGPPNPTPAPESTLEAVPAPTQAPQLSATAAPIVAAVPTLVPLAVTAAAVKVPPTARPQPKPTAQPTAAPTPAPQATTQPQRQPQTPAPQPPKAVASAAPLVAQKPVPSVTPGGATPLPASAPKEHGAAPSPGPKTPGSPGPRAVVAQKGPAVPRPIQAPPPTPRPQTPPSNRAGKTHPSLLARLQSLIPTANPSWTPAPAQHYRFGVELRVTPEPEPTPPPDVLAATKYVYEENVGSQRWKQSFLGTAPEEAYVKMYVTGVKRVGFIKWCTGWVVRAPIAGSSKWIVEANESFICGGHLEPFNQPAPEPSAGS